VGIWAIVILVVLILIVVGGIASYNRFVSQRNLIKDAWANIDTELRRRYDLIPNLVSTVQGYAGHEAAVLGAVADARSAAIAASGPAAQGRAESTLASDVRSVFAVAEAYPELKASAAFVELQDQLTATEDGLEHARQFYNDAVYGYLNAVQKVPTSLVASLFGFRPREFFQAAAADRPTIAVRL